MKPEKLRAYARLFEAFHTDSDCVIFKEMAQCARIVADAIERDDPYLPPGWRNAQPKEST